MDEKSKLIEFVGKNVFVRTITYHTVGHIVAIADGFLWLNNASWIADSGRFSNAIVDGVEFLEIEPVGDCLIALDSIVDLFPYRHTLPTAQK